MLRDVAVFLLDSDKNSHCDLLLNSVRSCGRVPARAMGVVEVGVEVFFRCFILAAAALYEHDVHREAFNLSDLLPSMIMTCLTNILERLNVVKKCQSSFFRKHTGSAEFTRCSPLSSNRRTFRLPRIMKRDKTFNKSRHHHL